MMVSSNNWAILMVSLLLLVDQIIGLYVWLIIAGVVLSWLTAFNVVNTHNRFVGSVMNALYQLTEPALRPIRRLLPNFGGIDISPVILIFGLFFIQNLIRYDLAPWLIGGTLR